MTTMAHKVATTTAICTLFGTLFYASTFAWAATHAQYAKADAVDYLYRKQVEVDIWRYEEEIAKLNDVKTQLEKVDAPQASVVDRVRIRIARLKKRLDRLDAKLEGFN